MNPIKKLVLFLAVLMSCGSIVLADEGPDPSKTLVWPDYNGGCLIAPGPLAGTTLNILARNQSNQPIANATVRVWFNSQIRVCANAVHTVTTDSEGRCTIELRGGGCINTATSGACSVTVNGIEAKGYILVKSPDNSQHTHSAADGTVTIGDLPFFADEFRGLVPAGCHDYNNDHLVTVADLPVFGDSFVLGLSCPLP